MLVLSRKAEKGVVIDNRIIVHVVEIRGNLVRLGFEAPTEIPIHRHEVWLKIQRAAEAEENAKKQRASQDAGAGAGDNGSLTA